MMPMTGLTIARTALPAFLVCMALLRTDARAQAPSAVGGIHPNIAGTLARPLRYQPEGDAFVISNGAEHFNRPLYGGNTAFRVDGGDKPEFVLYLPGRGGNLRFAMRTGQRIAWLHDAASIRTVYRPGELVYEIRDPLFGTTGVLRLTALAYHQTEGFIVRCEADNIAAGVELLWVYGGVNGERGRRDGDIGTEAVPISEWFRPRPEFAADNKITAAAGRFVLEAKQATIVGATSDGGAIHIADANSWGDVEQLFAMTRSAGSASEKPLATGHLTLDATPSFLSLQRVGTDTAPAAELDTYSAVTAARNSVKQTAHTPALSAEYSPAQLAGLFTATRKHFAALRTRVVIDTPDSYLNAAVAALNVAADAVWDEPEQAIMHGAIAWRTKLLGWRGPYALDALGWHDRAQANFRYWFGRQNTNPIPATLPPADEDTHLARNEAGLHSNGDMANAHYDMNAVFIDALFRHLDWTGDIAFAREAWPVIERHIAWERRLFRREFGAERLPLYEAYAQIWASDDLQYSGGGVAYASAYNLYHNRMAAKLARLLGHNPKPYEDEATAIGKAMRAQLWLPAEGAFAEYKDLLGEQRVHPSAGLWSFYHTIDSGVPTAREAWSMAAAVERTNPRLPIEGPGVPTDARYEVLATTDWMPYSWSLNNVVMAENIHAALGFWQAGRSEAAFRLAKSALLASMYMGISPGNVGSMNYLDVYRREAQRDFADGSGVMSRAIVEGLFGVKPDALAGVLEVRPGLPIDWTHAKLAHPDIQVAFERRSLADRWTITQTEARFHTLKLRFPATHERIAAVTLNGVATQWRMDAEAVGRPAIEVEIAAPAACGRPNVIAIEWAGAEIRAQEDKAHPDAGHARRENSGFVRAHQGAFTWWRLEARQAPSSVAAHTPSPASQTARDDDSPFSAQHLRHPTGMHPSTAIRRGLLDPVDLTPYFNDRVTEIFRPGKYRAPRSPFVSLALPAQGIGAWAGHVNATANIDDTGLRRAAANANNRFTLPNGIVFATPGAPATPNIIFTSQWSNYPREKSIPLSGSASHIHLLMAGSTNAMQSRLDNGEVIVAYTDGATTRFALRNPTTWWPIDQDYLVDDYQFRIDAPLPLRVDLMSGHVRQPEAGAISSHVGIINGGAATVLSFPLDPSRSLQSLTVHAIANDVVIGLMAATLARDK